MQMAYEYQKEPYERYDVLVELYWDETMSLKEVGDALGVGHWRIQTEMEKQGIPRRPSGVVRDWTTVSLADYLEELRQEEAAQNEEYNKLTWTDFARS